MTLHAPLLAADIETIMRIVIIILVIGGTVVGKLMAGMKQFGQPPPRPPQQGNVQTEIDEFLRRVQSRQGGPRPAPARRMPAAEQTAQPVQAVAIDQDADEPVGVEVVKHVEKYLDTGDFSRRSAQLGGEVIQANAQLDQSVQKAFSHEVGRLVKKPGETAVAPQALMTDEAAPLAQVVMPPLSLSTLFGDPDAIRQAILASEIFPSPRGALGVEFPSPLRLRVSARVLFAAIMSAWKLPPVRYSAVSAPRRTTSCRLCWPWRACCCWPSGSAGSPSTGTRATRPCWP